MHCKTEAEAQEFCDLLHWAGRTWNSGVPYSEKTNFDYYGENTAYLFNDGRVGNVNDQRKNDYVVLEWSDFKNFLKSDLKTGDICLQRDGLVQIYIKNLDMFVTRTGFNVASDFKDDLTEKHGTDYDIIAVRRPNKPSQCQFMAFDCKFGDLIYERHEPEEMTLEEVCKLLGKEIKIVKSKEVK